MARVIFHIDLNAFFASAEEIKHPELEGLPLAVGSLSKRSVLSTANYIAREYGVHSAMPVYEALEKCPELVIVEGDYNYYRALSAQFFEYLKRYSTMIEIASIDECYMDVTETIKKYKRPLDLAYQIQNGVYETLHLNVSIGVAPNRFLAKMASDMRKPKGITILRKSEIEMKLWPLPIETMHGIGKKTVPQLKKIGIETIGDFADEANEQKIMQLLKRNGYSMIQKARGNSSATLHCSTTRKSLSVSRTFENDLYTMDEVLVKVRTLCQNASDKLKQESQKGKLISLSLRDTEFKNIVRSISLPNYTNEYPVLYNYASNLVEEYFEPVGYRHIGIHIGSLQNADKIISQLSLFEEPIQDTQTIVEQLNKKSEGKYFMRASDLIKRKDNE
ncbi:MAG: DNA polymerase IV [Holdemanella sp.]|nr:DNA polymerase IV [Holdemanella sp.]